ncbi:DUF3037 domain-containing protein [Klebsiella aerogenes]|uniref:DUF3037 domain-containing protein n=1 Tax=Klebsiella aerogenes TaxID=548 RepID=UPI0022891EE2|nr:DUF3037 domain-containing protein [Klebsiella aerogenes]MEA8782099.1 DUF3037 domain-containing protein [Klebsiella aerogenes]MEC5621967.1 DUF3037 domain-containing protein [Klebsiella aerogenes]HCA3691055.1 DUF3037 domain-containing protein [Klebsiella aerogenes]HCT6902997.1 DUF3037 domain-containing protein [Klebsiella aerogenes]HCT7094150.1 DUF3037 domain-containing protein [Klebsiella aerogenes]
MKTFKYSLIRVTPNLEKGETINVGLIVYRDNEIDVRMINSVSKLRAIDKNLNLDYLDDLTSSFFELSKSINDILLFPRLFKGSLSLSDFGVFTVTEKSNYEIKINELMNRLVNPQKTQHKKANRKIFFDIKDTFIKHGIFSKYDEDLYHHKIVANYPISSDEGLSADFLLKNGRYHLTETIDFRPENIKKQMGEAALSVLTISKATDLFNNNINSFVIYAAETTSQEKVAKHQLNLLEKHADMLINAYSREDMSVYYEKMLSASSMLN